VIRRERSKNSQLEGSAHKKGKEREQQDYRRRRVNDSKKIGTAEERGRIERRIYTGGKSEGEGGWVERKEKAKKKLLVISRLKKGAQWGRTEG